MKGYFGLRFGIINDAEEYKRILSRISNKEDDFLAIPTNFWYNGTKYVYSKDNPPLRTADCAIKPHSVDLILCAGHAPVARSLRRIWHRWGGSCVLLTAIVRTIVYYCVHCGAALAPEGLHHMSQ